MVNSVGKSILLIEPDILLGKRYAHALTGHGHKIRRATNAQDAITSLDSHLPDLILLEISMQDHNGIEFLYELHSYADTAKIPILLLTNVAYDDLGISDQLGKQFSIAGYCYKPKTTVTKLAQEVASIKLGASV